MSDPLSGTGLKMGFVERIRNSLTLPMTVPMHACDNMATYDSIRVHRHRFIRPETSSHSNHAAMTSSDLSGVGLCPVGLDL